jgi:hypothetical protein
MFKLMSRFGELVVDRPTDVKFVLASMVPSEMPCVLTLERTPVTDNPAVKGFASATETWATLFSCPVVGSTKQLMKQRLWKGQSVLTSQRCSREKVSLQARKRHTQADRLECLLKRRNFRTPAVARNGDQRICGHINVGTG